MESLAEMRQERDFVRKRLESLLASISAADKKAKTAAKEKTDAGISLVKDAGLSVKEMQKAYARKSKEQATLESYRKCFILPVVYTTKMDRSNEMLFLATV